MKYLYILITCFLAFSCNSNQKVLAAKDADEITIYCPKDGICTFEILKSRSLKILKDEFDNLYPEISDGDNIILKFEYKRNEIPNTVDGHYSELIYVELNSNKLIIELENSKLQEVNLLFARLCFCRGQTGYYKVKKGKLAISKENDKYQFNLEFKIDEVPQIITSINQTFTLNK